MSVCCRQTEFPLDVEEYVCLAFGHRLLVGVQDGGVVEVVPVAVLRHEGRVVAGTRPEKEKKEKMN